jgi:protein-S-isoprenylcysteine O-methyltransferase Ste14
MLSFLKVFLALSAYAALHSALLTSEARLLIESLVGQRAYRGFFRLAYSLLAVVLFVVFLGYAANVPAVPLFELGGWIPWVLSTALRLAGVALIVWALRAHGFAAWLGFTNFKAWRHGQDPGNDGLEGERLVSAGPYRWVRHPMYAGALLFLWPVLTWTANYLALCLAGTLYLWLGALHEEYRLLRRFGREYAEYMARTPRFLPFGRPQGAPRV